MIKKENSSEIRISGSKVKDNFKHRWTVCLVSISLSLVVAVISTIMTFLSSDTGESSNYYQATTKVYVNWDESVSNAFRTVSDNATQNEAWAAYAESYQNYISIYLQEWQKTKVNAAITDSNNYMKSNNVRNRLNEVLTANGYDEINGCDVISFTSTGTSHLFTLSVAGYGDSDRVQFLTTEAARIFIEEGQDKLDLVDCRVIDDPEVYKVTRSQTKTGTVTFTRDEYYPDRDVAKVMEKEDSSDSTLSIILSKKNIVIVSIGIVVGLGIILIHILKDKKIREMIEVESITDLKYLGTVDGDDERTCDTVSSTIASMCQAHNIENMYLVSQKRHENDRYDDLEDAILDYGVQAGYAGEINNAKVIKTASRGDGIVLLIVAGKDDEKELRNALNTLEIIKANVLGYVLYK